METTQCGTAPRLLFNERLNAISLQFNRYAEEAIRFLVPCLIAIAPKNRHLDFGASLSQDRNSRSWGERLQAWFPDREFFMRSQGQVRFIKISSRMQKGAALAAVVLAVGWAGSMSVMAWNNYVAESNIASFQEEKARIADSRERIEAYGSDLDSVVEDLQIRQELLDNMVEMLPEEIQTVDTNVTDSSEETAGTAEQLGALFP